MGGETLGAKAQARKNIQPILLPLQLHARFNKSLHKSDDSDDNMNGTDENEDNHKQCFLHIQKGFFFFFSLKFQANKNAHSRPLIFHCDSCEQNKYSKLKQWNGVSAVTAKIKLFKGILFLWINFQPNKQRFDLTCCYLLMRFR